jgi:hypothetical protein
MPMSTKVNIYAPAKITLVTTPINLDALKQGQKFSLIATLTGGYNVPIQSLTFKSSTGYLVNNGVCPISSAVPKCTVDGAVATLDYNGDKKLTVSNNTFSTLVPAMPSMKVTDEYEVFVTNATYDGNLDGLAGADAKCNVDSNKPTANNYKALLAGNKAAPFGVTYYRAGVPISFYEDGLGVWHTNDGITNYRLRNPITVERKEVWTGWNPEMEAGNSAGRWGYKTSAGWDYNGSNSNCNGWTDNAYQRYTGVVGYTDLVTPSDGNNNIRILSKS